MSRARLIIVRVAVSERPIAAAISAPGYPLAASTSAVRVASGRVSSAAASADEPRVEDDRLGRGRLVAAHERARVAAADRRPAAQRQGEVRDHPVSHARTLSGEPFVSTSTISLQQCLLDEVLRRLRVAAGTQRDTEELVVMALRTSSVAMSRATGPAGRVAVDPRAGSGEVAAVMGVAFVRVVDTRTMRVDPCGATTARLR